MPSIRGNFCSLSVSSAREIERSALTILNYNISISNPDWVGWLLEMKTSASSYPPPCKGKPVINIVDGLLSAGPKVSGKYLRLRPKPIARPTPFELSSKFYSQVMRDLCVPKLLEPSPFHSISDPAPWNPVEDRIITPRAHGRTNGTAPGALSRTTNAMDLVSVLNKNGLTSLRPTT